MPGPKQRELSDTELRAIEDEIIAAAPLGMSNDDFENYFAPRFEQAVAEAEYTPQAGPTPGFGSFISNLGQAINPVPMIQGAYGMVRHPIDTANAIAGQHAQQFQRGLEAASRPSETVGGRLLNASEAVGHFAASALPLVGPQAAAIGEQAGEGDIPGATGQFVGSVGAKMGGAGVGALAQTQRGAQIAGALERGAASRFQKVMAPELGGRSKFRFGQMAEKVAPALSKMEDLATWTREGLLGKLTPKLQTAEDALDAAHDARLNALTFDTQPIIDALKKKRQDFVSESVEASAWPHPDPNFTPQRSKTTGQMLPGQGVPLGQDVIPAPSSMRVATLDKAIAELEQLGPKVRYESLRRMRASWDQPARRTYAKTMQDYFEKTAESASAADITGVLREHLGRFDPATAAANAEYSLFKNATDVLKATEEIEKARPTVMKKILNRVMGATAGAAAGGTPGAAIGFVMVPAMEAALSGGVTTKLKFAKLQNQLARFIRTGDETGILATLHHMSRIGPAVGAMQRYQQREQPPSGSDLFLSIQSQPQR